MTPLLCPMLTMPFVPSLQLSTEVALPHLFAAIERMHTATSFADRVPLYRNVIAELLRHSFLLDAHPSLRSIAAHKVIETRQIIHEYRQTSYEDLEPDCHPLEGDLFLLECTIDELDATLSLMGHHIMQ